MPSASVRSVDFGNPDIEGFSPALNHKLTSSQSVSDQASFD